MSKVSISYNQQAAQLPEIKEIRPEYHDIHSQVLQDVLRRVKKAYDNFFRRIKEGKTPGYPRFQGYGRYDSFTFPQSGFSLIEDNRVCLSKIGTIKIKMQRNMEGRVKTCTIKREGQHWYIIFTCEVEQKARIKAPEKSRARSRQGSPAYWEPEERFSPQRGVQAGHRLSSHRV
jgi:putative transposase